MIERMLGVWRGLSRAGRVVLVGLVALVLTNVAQFLQIEEKSWIYFSALHHRDSGDVLQAAWREDPNSSSRFSMFFALSFLAPGSTLLVADEGSVAGDDYFVERAFAFGDVADVETVPGDALEAIEGRNLLPLAAASGSGGFRGPAWAIVVPMGAADQTFPRGYLGSAFGGKDVSTIGPQEFLVVRYPDETLGDVWGYRWVLVDLRLLPAGTIG